MSRAVGIALVVCGEELFGGKAFARRFRAIGKATAGGMELEAATVLVIVLVGWKQGQPADGAGDVVFAAEHLPINENAHADAGADGDKDGVARASRRSLPALTKNVTGTVAFDRDRKWWSIRVPGAMF